MLIKPTSAPAAPDGRFADINSWTYRLIEVQIDAMNWPADKGLPGTPSSATREDWWTNQILKPLANLMILDRYPVEYLDICGRLEKAGVGHRWVNDGYRLAVRLSERARKAIKENSRAYARFFGSPVDELEKRWIEFSLMADFPGDPRNDSDLKTLFWLDRQLNPEPFKREPGWREFREDVQKVLLRLIGGATKTPYYQVEQDGEQVAEVWWVDLRKYMVGPVNDPDAPLRLFKSTKWVESFLDGVKAFGLQEALDAVSARQVANGKLILNLTKDNADSTEVQYDQDQEREYLEQEDQIYEQQDKMIRRLEQELDGKGGASAASMSFLENDILEVTSADPTAQLKAGDLLMVTQFNVLVYPNGKERRELRLERLTDTGRTMGVQLKVYDTATWMVWLRRIDPLQLSTRANTDSNAAEVGRLKKVIAELTGVLDNSEDLSQEDLEWLGTFDRAFRLQQALPGFTEEELEQAVRQISAVRAMAGGLPARPLAPQQLRTTPPKKQNTPVKVRILEPNYVVDPEPDLDETPEFEIPGVSR